MRSVAICVFCQAMRGGGLGCSTGDVSQLRFTTGTSATSTATESVRFVIMTRTIADLHRSPEETYAATA